MLFVGLTVFMLYELKGMHPQLAPGLLGRNSGLFGGGGVKTLQ